MGALVGEPDGARASDAARRTGDDGYFAFEPSGMVISDRMVDGRGDQEPVAMKTFFSSVNASRASGPSSRPMPERLKPPKGVQ